MSDNSMMVSGKLHKLQLTVLMGLVVTAGLALGGRAADAADDPTGYWATAKRDSQIKISRCGTDGICGIIYWMKEPNDAKGNPRLDHENQDETKRKRSLLNMPLIEMQPDDEHWSGTVYNPQNGKTYSAHLKVLNPNEVEIKGCVAYVLCGGETWKREEPKVAGVPAVAAGHLPASKAAAAGGVKPIVNAKPAP